MVSLFVTGLHLREDVGQRVSSQITLSMAHVDNRKLKNIKKKNQGNSTLGDRRNPRKWLSSSELESEFNLQNHKISLENPPFHSKALRF